MAKPPLKPHDLSERIARAQAREEERKKPKTPAGSAAAGYGVGMRMTLDLVGGVIVGLVFGYAFDEIFNSEPWGLLVMLFLGMGAGFRNMLATAGRFGAQVQASAGTSENSEHSGVDRNEGPGVS